MLRRLILVTLLMMLDGGPVYGEWLEVGSSDNAGGYIVYVDPDTMRRTGNLVTMWVLFDYKTMQKPASLSYLSSRVQKQYDCAEEVDRRLEFTWFSANMSSGNVMYTNSDEGKWRPVTPGSIGQTLWKAACANK